MDQLTLLLALFAATVLLAPVAERFSIPYPVLLLVLGLAAAFVPGLPAPSINPELILPLVLPPLLFAAARRTSWREFLDNRRAIGLLAVALVAVTACSVGMVLQKLVPGLPLVAAIALGAAVAPPDPVAATAVARRLRLPRRLRTTLEGEGLSNDATSLVLYEVAVAGAVTGAFSPWGAISSLVVAVVGGIVTGLLVAVVVRWLLGKLPAHPAGTALVLLMPFAAYGAADAAHGSGVLAVVTLALALSRYADAESAQTRLVSGTAWDIIELLVTGAAFAYVGLELRAIAASVPGDRDELIGQALVITVLVIVVRFAWIFPVATIDQKLRARRDPEAEPVGWRERTVASWSGMRGVVTLAAVLALPPGFPERDRLIFIAVVVITVTLLLQGLTLPLLVRRLGVHASPDEERDMEHDLSRRARDAAYRRLEEVRAEGEVDDELIDEAHANADTVWHRLGFDRHDGSEEQKTASAEHATRAGDLETELLTAAREAIVAARSERGTDPTIVDGLLRRLDGHGGPPG
jgi:CPA1 family monovalent cation:H+ antiporter